ncbi:tRNA uridine-5-carboxymethylaminomethyl(34) synthesis GTPase MnmE [bacterium D16-76]|nr:tRNA uridine-5-carboxymethylaminomethyl(34) synthesis GTPase MnmE [bacterium D16-76]
MDAGKTIAAISTAQAPGGIGIVRISGPGAFEVADRVFRAKSGGRLAGCRGYTAKLGGAFAGSGEKLDDVVALVFRGPKSYTGEDVVELSCHGGLYITRRLLREVLAAGAVLAGPGEFTRRAYLNGKLDLAQAESVMQRIGASGEQAARAAQAVGDGALSRKIGAIREDLKGTAAHLAVWADFPDEGVPEVENEALLGKLRGYTAQLGDLLAGFEQGAVFREGVDTVICGRPNAGKSTLMNLLAGCTRSIVTQYPGTTRDIVEESVLVGGVPLRLADTAGLRETEDPVEKIGVEAARKRIGAAQLVLAVFDSSQPLVGEDYRLMEEIQGLRAIAIMNKTDLPSVGDREKIKGAFTHIAYISAATGQGLGELEEQIAQVLGTKEFNPADGILTTERQRADVCRAKKALEEAAAALSMGLTLDAVTVCVEDALTALYALTGQHVSDEVVDEVFSKFCVGK